MTSTIFFLGGGYLMPGFFTDYANNKILDQFFGNTPFASPATLYLGLSQTAANKAANIAEPSGGAYARAPLNNDRTHFPAASLGTKTNALPITFTAPSASWGTILSLFIADSATGGNILAMADLPVPKLILGGGTAPTLAANALYLSHT